MPHTVALPLGDGGHAVQAGSVGGVDQDIGQPGGTFRPGNGFDRIIRQWGESEAWLVQLIEGIARTHTGRRCHRRSRWGGMGAGDAARHQTKASGPEKGTTGKPDTVHLFLLEHDFSVLPLSPTPGATIVMLHVPATFKKIFQKSNRFFPLKPVDPDPAERTVQLEAALDARWPEPGHEPAHHMHLGW